MYSCIVDFSRAIFYNYSEQEHCQLNDWPTEWEWSKEVAGLKCGNGVKNRTAQVTAKHGGQSCEERYGCENEACYTKTVTKPCPGMFEV